MRERERSEGREERKQRDDGREERERERGRERREEKRVGRKRGEKGKKQRRERSKERQTKDKRQTCCWHARTRPYMWGHQNPLFCFGHIPPPFPESSLIPASRQALSMSSEHQGSHPWRKPGQRYCWGATGYRARGWEREGGDPDKAISRGSGDLVSCLGRYWCSFRLLAGRCSSL